MIDCSTKVTDLCLDSDRTTDADPTGAKFSVCYSKIEFIASDEVIPNIISEERH